MQTLVGKANFAPGYSDAEQVLVTQILAAQQQTQAVIPDLKTIESADAVFILGEDVTNTAPRLALALRQSVRNKAYALAAELRLETWQDEAIRNLAQDQRSPLFIATVADTPLDDVAQQRISLAPRDISRLGLAVADLLNGAENTHSGEDIATLAGEIASALKSAQRPLIISGTGCGSSEVIAAASAVTNALAAGGASVMLSLAVPEVNTYACRNS